MAITPKLIDELLDGCETSDDLLGQEGLLRKGCSSN